MDESERLGRQQGNRAATNFLRLLDPQSDPVAMLALTERLQRDVVAFPKLTIWMPEQNVLRQTPAFQDFLRRTHILDYRCAHGFPPQCRREDDAARCG